MFECGELDTLTFAEAFIRSGGIQIPGRPWDPQSDHIGALLVMALRGCESFECDDRDVLGVVERERTRAESETSLVRAYHDPRVTAYRVEAPMRGSAGARCRLYVARDMFGLGAGLVPLSEVVVLPPCCDAWRYRVIREA